MNFLDGLGETVNRAFCEILGNTVNQAEVLQYVLTPGFGPQFNPFPALYAQNCPLSPPPDPLPGSPFSGGQCVGVSYRVFFTTFSTAIPGNAGGQEDSENSDFIVLAGKINGSGQFDNGINWSGVIYSDGAPGGRTLVGSGSKSFFSSVSTTITSVVPVSGLPDTCGDPPAPVTPYTPGDNIYNGDVTYNNNEGDTVTIPVGIALGYATVNLNGNLNIPINANFALNPQFNGNFNYSPGGGGITPDFSHPASPLPPSCSDPGGYNPDPSIPAPPDSVSDPDPLPDPTTDPTERRKLLKGAIVTTSVLDGNETIIFQGDNPDLYVPSLGYVQFRIQVGDSGAWTNDIPVKCLRTFIPCPWEGGAIDVRGTPRYGNQFEVTPVYITRTFNPTYPPDS